MGCFLEATQTGSEEFTVPGGDPTYPTTQSVTENCQDLCRQKQYAYAGLSLGYSK